MVSRVTVLLLASVLALGLAACGSEDGAAVGGNGTDRAFVDDMIPHHKSAVEMAKIAQERGQSDFVKGLADDIVASQGEEIGTMEKIRPGLADVKPTPLGGGMGMGMGMEDVASLKTADPFDRAFIEMMLPHHQSAVEMAQVELDKGENSELKDLAEAIIEAQTREIGEMREALTSGS